MREGSSRSPHEIPYGAQRLRFSVPRGQRCVVPGGHLWMLTRFADVLGSELRDVVERASRTPT